jgi:hypothetical protein
MIEPAASSDMSVLIHQTTRRYIPKAVGPYELQTSHSLEVFYTYQIRGCYSSADEAPSFLEYDVVSIRKYLQRVCLPEDLMSYCRKSQLHDLYGESYANV